MSNGNDLKIYWENYGLIVIDESTISAMAVKFTVMTQGKTVICAF